jgi:hypothetical protein
MWRPETKAEKNDRENPKPAVEPIGNKHVVQRDQVADDQALRDAGCGWFVNCAKGLEYVMYVVCCCGCGTSYEDYNDLQ